MENLKKKQKIYGKSIEKKNPWKIHRKSRKSIENPWKKQQINGTSIEKTENPWNIHRKNIKSNGQSIDKTKKPMENL